MNMKRKFSKLAFILIALPLTTFLACSNEKANHVHHESHESHDTPINNKYACPMKCEGEKTYDHPGQCPVCKMKLQPAEEELIQVISPNRQVLSRQAVINPAFSDAENTVKSYGYIVADRDRNLAVTSRYGGRIEKLYVKYNNKYVKAGDKILDIYSPSIRTIQEEHLFLIRSGAENSMISKSREKQRLLGITEDQILQLEKSGIPAMTVTVVSPANGYVFFTNANKPGENAGPDLKTMDAMSMKSTTSKSTLFDPGADQLREGMYINEGQTLFYINDLLSVWALVTISEDLSKHIKENQAVNITVEGNPAIQLTGRLGLIERTFEENNQRFTRVRIPLSNRHGSLNLNMLATAEFRVNNNGKLQVPTSAVYNTGLNTYVWVRAGTTLNGTGIFQARRVKTTRGDQGKAIVLNGLNSSDEIALHAGLMIDSETYIKEY